MAKKKVELTPQQIRRNQEILNRLEQERRELIASTRALQEEERRARKRKIDE